MPIRNVYIPLSTAYIKLATCKQYDWWRGMGAERDDRFSYWLHKKHMSDRHPSAT